MAVYSAGDLVGFAAALLTATGLSATRAETVARGFLEADLLGYSTHGLARLPANLRWLERGTTNAEAEIEVLADAPALGSWDARFLPGPFVMHEAVAHAATRAETLGAYTLVLRRAQHIACLASYLVPVLERGLLGLIMASSPDERFVSPHGSATPLFSNNPVAFCAPTSTSPVLFDVSMAITAGGRVARAFKEGKRMPEACLWDENGQLTDDPAALERGGAVLPMGGPGHGHKGFALTIMTEVLTQALGGYGRVAQQSDGEANSVFVQVFDPKVIGAGDGYLAEVDGLLRSVAGCAPVEGTEAVRVPGARAWEDRRRRLRDGLELYGDIFESLVACGESLGIAPPSPLRS